MQENAMFGKIYFQVAYVWILTQKIKHIKVCMAFLFDLLINRSTDYEDTQ